MKQNSAYLLLYERKEPLDTEDLEPHMESKGMNMGGSGTGAGVEKDVKGGRIPVRVASEVLLTAEKMLEIDVEGEGEGEKGSRNDLVAPIFEDVKAAEERKRSSDADMSMFRYPSEAKGEGEDEGKREEDEDRKEGGGLEGEGGEGEIEGDKNRERRVNFSADSWDEFEIKKEESATQENVQEYNTHIHTPHKEDRSFLKPESGNGCKVRRRIQEYPPIAKKVLQAVWTENLEFQTDRSLFNRIHFNFLWQLQRSPVVVEMLTEKSKSGIHHSSSLPSSPTSPTASSSSASLLLPPPSAPSLDSFLIESQTNGISKSRSDSSSSSSSGSSRAHKTDPNKSITSPDSKYNDGAGHTGSTGKFLMENTLAQLSVTCLRFNVEVLARARASGCVHSVSSRFLCYDMPCPVCVFMCLCVYSLFCLLPLLLLTSFTRSVAHLCSSTFMTLLDLTSFYPTPRYYFAVSVCLSVSHLHPYFRIFFSLFSSMHLHLHPRRLFDSYTIMPHQNVAP